MFFKKVVPIMFITLFLIVGLSACSNKNQEKSTDDKVTVAQETNVEDFSNEATIKSIDSDNATENEEEIVTNIGDTKCSHDYYKESIVKATCTSPGYTTYKCKKCGAEKVGQRAKALDHVYDNGTIIKPSSCTENGTKTFRCIHCGKTKNIDLPALGHNYFLKNEKEATCTTNGEKTFACSNCNHTYSEPISSTEHNFNNWAASGNVHKHTCSKCGITESSSHVWDSDGDECVTCGIINFD